MAKLYKRGETWWYRFRFNGTDIRESTGMTRKDLAQDLLDKRRLELRTGAAGLKRAPRAQMFAPAADKWLKSKAATLSPRTVLIETLNLKHLNKTFGKKLLTDITADDISDYQTKRVKAEKASGKTCNLELGTLRAILRKHGLWAALQPHVRMMPTRDAIGKALSDDEERALLEQCSASRSRSLFIAVSLSLNLGLRVGEIKSLRWQNVDFERNRLTVPKSKTVNGQGRQVPLNSRIRKLLELWADQFPNRRPEHYVICEERYGGGGMKERFGFTRGAVYDCDPTQPIGTLKEAWEYAKERAGKALNPEAEKPEPLKVRFHDLRHTACTRLLDSGVSFPKVAAIMGWSPSNAIRMAKIYGHFEVAPEAMEVLVAKTDMTAMWAQVSQGSAQKRAQSPNEVSRRIQ